MQNTTWYEVQDDYLVVQLPNQDVQEQEEGKKGKEREGKTWILKTIDRIDLHRV